MAISIDDVAMNVQVSIVIPTRNRPLLTRRAIASACSQENVHLQVVVVDDGSTDDTAGVLAELSAEIACLVVIRQTNSGASMARNRGVAESKGHFVVFLDSDDELLPGAIEALVNAATRERASVVSSAAEIVDDAGAIVEEKRPRDLGPVYENQVGLFLAGTFLVRRDVFDAVGGFDPACPSSQHKDLALRLVPYCVREDKKMSSISATTVRVHAHSGVHLRSSLNTLLAGRIHALTTHEEQLQKSPRHYSHYCETAAVYAAKLGQFATARRLFRNAIRSYPKKIHTYMRLAAAHVPLLRSILWKA